MIANCKVTITRNTFNESTESNTTSSVYSNIDGNYYGEGVMQSGKDVVQDRVIKKAKLLIPNTCTEVKFKDTVEITMGSIVIGKFTIESIRPYIQFSDTIKLILTDGTI